jgi:hypothetical protein
MIIPFLASVRVIHAVAPRTGVILVACYLPSVIADLYDEFTRHERRSERQALALKALLEIDGQNDRDYQRIGQIGSWVGDRTGPLSVWINTTHPPPRDIGS